MYATFLAIFKLFLLHFLVFLVTAAKNEFELQFENFSCSSSPAKGNPLESFHCGLSKNAKRRSLNMEFALLEPLNEHEFHISIVLPRPTVDFLLINLTTDGCQLLSNKNQVPLLRISREILDRYSNFPRQCPFQRGKTYYIRGFRLDLDLIPAVKMETKVQINFGYLRKQIKILQGHLVARVQVKTIVKKKTRLNV